MDLGCAFSAALGAAERSSAWVVALALLQEGTDLRLHATGHLADVVQREAVMAAPYKQAEMAL